MNKRKLILSIITILIICSCGIGIAYKIYGDGQKDITDMFFDPDSREYIKNMTVYNDESIEIDDYKVALETSLYDSEVGIGYFVFSIEQTDEKTDRLEKFFEKYCFTPYITGSIRKEIETVGNKSYYYLGIESSLWADDSDTFKDKIHLIERESAEDVYVFDLISISNNQKYEYENKQIVLSPIGMRINRDDFIKPNTVVFRYNDGKKDKTIVEDSCLQEKNNDNLGGMGGENGNYAYICSFKNIIDISSVESILVDGIEYKLIAE